MNFAVIGLGSFGVKRAKAIKSSKNAKLVCIFDPNKNNAQKAEKELNVPCKSFQEILKNKEIDVICICTPNKFHKELIIESQFQKIIKKRKKYSMQQKNIIKSYK